MKLLGKDEGVIAYLGLGSNMGSREDWLREAIRRLEEHPAIQLEACSAVYETEPVGFLEQPAFLNMAVRIRTILEPMELLAVLQQVELQLERKREIRWGPRTIDVDLLLYGDITIDMPELTVPHPRMLERAFVLIPLQDVHVGLTLPLNGSLSEQLDTLEGKEGVKLWTNKL